MHASRVPTSACVPAPTPSSRACISSSASSARPLLRQLALRLLERPLLRLQQRLELEHALLEASLLGRARGAAGAQVIERPRELGAARRVLDLRQLQGLALEAHLLEARCHLACSGARNRRAWPRCWRCRRGARGDGVPALGDSRVGRGMGRRGAPRASSPRRRCARPARPPRRRAPRPPCATTSRSDARRRRLLAHLALLALRLLLALRERRRCGRWARSIAASSARTALSAAKLAFCAASSALLGCVRPRAARPRARPRAPRARRAPARCPA